VPYDRRFDEVRNAPLLVLDDLGTQSATAWAREKLYQLFNYRYNARLPTVVTMSMAVEDLEKTDPKLASRFLDTSHCRVIAIAASSYRGGPQARRKNRK
jgi:DNA replication protein DnaC